MHTESHENNSKCCKSINKWNNDTLNTFNSKFSKVLRLFYVDEADINYAKLPCQTVFLNAFLKNLTFNEPISPFLQEIIRTR